MFPLVVVQLHNIKRLKKLTVNPIVTTLSTVKSQKDSSTEPDTLIGIQTAPATKNSQQTPSNHDGDKPSLGVTDEFFGVPEFEDNSVLPDLSRSREVTTDDVLNQTQEPISTEEELDAADMLLSLSNVRDDFNLGVNNIDDNSLLMPIGGQSTIEDVAPEPIRLGQVDVDEGIARMLAVEEQEQLEGATKIVEDSHSSLNALPGVPTRGLLSISTPNTEPGTDSVTEATSANLLGIQNSSNSPKQTDTQQDSIESSTGGQPATNAEDVHKGAHPKIYTEDSTDVVTKKGSHGAFKSQLYGLRHSTLKDRSYRCKICGTTKRSMENLNDHHRQKHGKQQCEVCGKKFVLATPLTHHMYSHFPRKFYCNKCDFHCCFQSELDSHKISHWEKPSYQCMYPKCGRWFKCKGELTLHVEIHNKLWYDCSKCDFSTKLVKYLKEHEKSHKKELPYSCDLCGQRFLWRSGVKRHKEKDH